MNGYFSEGDLRTANRHMKRYSSSSSSSSSSGKYKSKPQRDTTLHLSERGKINNRRRNTSYWQGCREKGTLCTVGGNANWCSHSGEVQRFLKKLKIELPYDPVIALLGIYQRIQKYRFKGVYDAP